MKKLAIFSVLTLAVALAAVVMVAFSSEAPVAPVSTQTEEALSLDGELLASSNCYSVFNTTNEARCEYSCIRKGCEFDFFEAPTSCCFCQPGSSW